MWYFDSVPVSPVSIAVSHVTTLPGRLLRSVLFIALVAALGACNSGSIVCPAVVVPALRIEVRDAATGAPAAQGASGTARIGDRVFTLRTSGPGEQLVLDTDAGPPGSYTVLVQKPGYRDFTKSVFVEGGACGVVRTVLVRVDLVRSS